MILIVNLAKNSSSEAHQGELQSPIQTFLRQHYPEQNLSTELPAEKPSHADIMINHHYHPPLQEPITWSLHFPYNPLESTLSDEKLFIEVAFAEYFSRLLSNIQSKQSYDHTSHAESQKRNLNCCQQWR